eukprot:m.249280 g.249280  ORF g.249280 m.249280 type:complete len:138 (-) comp16059_c0_seq1:170-583(-)
MCQDQATGLIFLTMSSKTLEYLLSSSSLQGEALVCLARTVGRLRTSFPFAPCCPWHGDRCLDLYIGRYCPSWPKLEAPMPQQSILEEISIFEAAAAPLKFPELLDGPATAPQPDDATSLYLSEPAGPMVELAFIYAM